LGYAYRVEGRKEGRDYGLVGWLVRNGRMEMREWKDGLLVGSL
jgi:hypothetical protein